MPHASTAHPVLIAIHEWKVMTSEARTEAWTKDPGGRASVGHTTSPTSRNAGERGRAKKGGIATRSKQLLLPYTVNGRSARLPNIRGLQPDSDGLMLFP